MREILFRGKRVDNGDWVQGHYYGMWGKKYIFWGENNHIPEGQEVIPETLGQYTGYQEKKTGRMLFDGDNFSVETWEDDGRKSLAYFTVCWDNNRLCWMAKSLADSIYDESLTDIIDDSLEIIGNIFDEVSNDSK